MWLKIHLAQTSLDPDVWSLMHVQLRRARRTDSAKCVVRAESAAEMGRTYI